MPKKRGSTKKRTVKHKTPKKKLHTDNKIEKVLVENFVSLQKVMTNLSVKFDNLSNQISRLLDLFEISAKALAEKGVDMKVDNKEVIEKIDNLSEQNKLIARGLSLMHEGRVGQDSPPLPMQKAQTPQIPRFSPAPPLQKSVVEQNQDIGEQQRITEANQNPETYWKDSRFPYNNLTEDILGIFGDNIGKQAIPGYNQTGWSHVKLAEGSYSQGIMELCIFSNSEETSVIVCWRISISLSFLIKSCRCSVTKSFNTVISSGMFMLDVISFWFWIIFFCSLTVKFRRCTSSFKYLIIVSKSECA